MMRHVALALMLVALVGCAASHERDPSQRVASLHVDAFGGVVAMEDGTVRAWGDLNRGTPMLLAPTGIDSLRGSTQVVSTPWLVCGLIGERVVCEDLFRPGPIHAASDLHVESLRSTELLIFARTREGGYWMLTYDVIDPDGLRTTRLPFDASDVIDSSGQLLLLQHGRVSEVWGWSNEHADPPVPFPDLADATALTHASSGGCMLLPDRTVRCWPRCDLGANDWRRPCWTDLDGGHLIDVEPDDFYRDPGLHSVVEVDAAGNPLAIDLSHPPTCARLEDGSVWCWGGNGCGSRERREWRPEVTERSDCVAEIIDAPRRVDLPTAATHVGVGRHHACALLDDGSVWCWGSNFHGQLGNGTRVDSPDPVRVLLPRQR